jgi:hypothetical protein
MEGLIDLVTFFADGGSEVHTDTISHRLQLSTKI